ncbi:MAG: peptidoglycan DD-metalloendopeptidase family protein [Geminicoccaceae bacterium]
MPHKDLGRGLVIAALIASSGGWSLAAYWDKSRDALRPDYHADKHAQHASLTVTDQATAPEILATTRGATVPSADRVDTLEPRQPAAHVVDLPPVATHSDTALEDVQFASIAPGAGPVDEGPEATVTPPAQRPQAAAHALPPIPKLAPPRPSRSALTVRRGDTLVDVLNRGGLSSPDVNQVIDRLDDVFDPRDLRAGQALTFVRAGKGEPIEAIELATGFAEGIRLARAVDGFDIETFERPLESRRAYAAGTVEGSLYLSARRANMPDESIMHMVKLLSHDVDFQRDVRRGDGFEVVYEVVSPAGDSDVVRGAEPLYVRLTTGGREIEAIRFELPDGMVDYFDRHGHSVRKLLMRTPIDGARLTSGFGMRRHPILGYSKLHTGVDFGAPTGTPVFAAGDGVIEKASRFGGYGNYVRVRHNSEFKTAYAHLSRYGKDIKPGVRVKQGQVIGYVGSTGRSTGPHLHYEILQGGKPINPMSLKQTHADNLTGADFKRFEQLVADIDRERAIASRGGTVTADASATVPIRR